MTLETAFRAMALFAAVLVAPGLPALALHEGAVWEKNLGPRTTAIASAIRRYNPDQTWKPSPHGAAEVPRAPAPRP